MDRRVSTAAKVNTDGRSIVVTVGGGETSKLEFTHRLRAYYADPSETFVFAYLVDLSSSGEFAAVGVCSSGIMVFSEPRCGLSYTAAEHAPPKNPQLYLGGRKKNLQTFLNADKLFI